MSNLPLTTRVYALVLVVLTAIAVSYSGLVNDHAWTRHDALTAVVLFALIVLTDRFEIAVPHQAGTFTVSVNAVLHLATGLMLGPFHGTLQVLAAELVANALARR